MVGVRIVDVRHELLVAAMAARRLQQPAAEEVHVRSGAREVEHQPGAVGTDVFEVQHVALDRLLDATALVALWQESVEVIEQRRVDVRLQVMNQSMESSSISFGDETSLGSLQSLSGRSRFRLRFLH
jgi:hypothetical protein